MPAFVHYLFRRGQTTQLMSYPVFVCLFLASREIRECSEDADHDDAAAAKKYIPGLAPSDGSNSNDNQ